MRTMEDYYRDAAKYAPFGPYCHELEAEAMAEINLNGVYECRAAVASPKFHHARARYSSVWVYHLDPTSPSGFILAGAGSDAVVDSLCREFRKAPAISPTERA